MEKIRTLALDLETFSSVDLVKCGTYKYAESPDFEILLFAYSVNEAGVVVVDLANGETIPEKILAALADDSVEKWAYNAQFERVCLSNWLRRNAPEHFKSYGSREDTVGGYLSPYAWKCSRVWGAYMGLPLSLKGIGAVLKLDEQKMDEGKELIRYFCKPCRPTKANGGRARNLPCHAPEKWALFKKYNKRDVEVELGIKARLAKFPVPDFVWDEYHLDQEINDRGILIDMELVKQAIAIDTKTKEALRSRMQETTGLENPNSVAQMKSWLADKGIETESLDKKAVKELLPGAEADVADALSCRQQLAKSSVSKYAAMQNAVCADGRARGMFQFYGANRTGRWSGKIVQLQNLPQNHMDDLEEARALVRDGNFEALEMLYDNIPGVLSELIRTAFIPKPGYKFIVSDFSAIEARVLSYIARERWRMDVFKNGGDIYCETASRMFHCKVEKHGENGHLRQYGKVAELACIAEGQLVLTDDGLVPIEKVTPHHKLWDGENWVCNDGVIFKGEREVITYEGLTATPDHLVWVEGQSEPIQFGIAASCGAHLLQTGNGGTAIRMGEDYQPGEALEQSDESLLCVDPMHWMRFNTMDKFEQSPHRKIQGMPKLLPAKVDSTLAEQAAHGSKATVRKPERSGIYELRRTGHQIQFFERQGIGTILAGNLRASLAEDGIGSHRHERRLHQRKPEICNKDCQSGESQNHRAIGVSSKILAIRAKCCDEKTLTGHDPLRYRAGSEESRPRKAEKLAAHKRTARLYDVKNAGEHHRFTVSGKLVHNCGYGGSVGALKAFGAIEAGMEEEELKPMVDAWRTANPNIVRFWWNIDTAVKNAVKYKEVSDIHGFKIYCRSGMLFIDLPAGRKLCYIKPKMGVNQFGTEAVTYEGTNLGKWTRIESYGPKFVENIVQAVSRDILAYAMKTLRHIFIVGSVHDELIIECNEEASMRNISGRMSIVPPWLPKIALQADGYECRFYKKE